MTGTATATGCRQEEARASSVLQPVFFSTPVGSFPPTPSRAQNHEGSGHGAACGSTLTPCGSSVRGAGRRAACEVQAISVLEPEAGVPSRALLCSLPPNHFTFTQQVLTYLVPAGGLALGWALGVFLQDTHDCHFPVGYFLDGG